MTPRLILLAAFLPLCWLGMQVVHEAGHVLMVWVTGGTVQKVVLHPLAISRTDVSPNPSPVAVVWGGPLFGTLAPIGAWLVVRGLGWRSKFLWRFFAGFCLVANGVYVGLGVVQPVGDAADLLRFDTPAWELAVFGLIAVIGGFALWNGQARFFGLGEHPHPVERSHASSVAALLFVLVAGEFAWSAVTGLARM